MSTPSFTTIDLLRHGQTVADDILRGRIDVPLSGDGYRQMRDRLQQLMVDKAPWQHLVTSPLQRCAQFAADLGEQHNLPVSIDDGFLEMDFGDWDGCRLEDLQAENPAVFASIWREPHKYAPPNGESFREFNDRICDAWDRLLDTHRGEHLLLICHGGVIRALFGSVMDSPITSLSRVEVPYACLTRVRIYHQPGQPCWPQLIFHNPQ